MKHIFGMAKSNLDLKGAKGPKLELDYLRLIYAAKEHKRKGFDSDAFLLVMTPEIANRVQTWNSKYDADGVVNVVTANMSITQKEALSKEKKNNIHGMVAGTTGRIVAGRSDAKVGKEIGESQLRAAIMKKYPEVKEITKEAEFPYAVLWDFYGVVHPIRYVRKDIGRES